MLWTSAGTAEFVRTIWPPPVIDAELPTMFKALSTAKLTEMSAAPPAGTVTVVGDAVTVSPAVTFDFTVYVTVCVPLFVTCSERDAVQLVCSIGARPRLTEGGSMRIVPDAAAYVSIRPAPPA